MDFCSVNRDRCVGCGLCVRICSRELLGMGEDNLPFMPPGNQGLCMRCGHCSAVCPEGALVLDIPGTPRSLRAELALTPAQADQFLASCRSVRRYKPEPVTRGEIENLLEVARLAPTGSNKQPVRYLVLHSRETVRKAGDLVIEWFDKVARTVPQYAARYNIDAIIARHAAGKDPMMRNAPCAVIAYTRNDMPRGAVDSAIALTYFALAANARGIGSCWLGYLMRAAKEYAPVREYLGIDGEYAVQGMLVFGYADVTFHALPGRNPVHVNWME